MNIQRLLALLACALLTLTATAQQMPQDNWRYDGLQFASPSPNDTLSSIGLGAGGVYVANYNGNSTPTNILQFTQGGVFVRNFSATFNYISGIACDPAGNVYVFDSGTSTVKAFDQNGSFLRQWGSAGNGNGQFGAGAYGYVQMITVDKNSQVYVCDPGNSRVQVFDTNGNFLRQWGQQGNLPSQFGTNYPNGIGVALDGRVFVSGQDYRITVFDSGGTYITSNSNWPTLGYGYDGPHLCVSFDGLLLMPVYGIIAIFDRAFNPLTTSTGYYPPGQSGSAVGSAVSIRGDIYTVVRTYEYGVGTRGYIVYVYEREYSNVQNSLLPPAIPQPLVLAAAQRSGTSWMDIDYQVTDADSATVTTGLLAFKNGGTTLTDAVVMSTFMEGTGANVGLNIATGVSKHVTWNMAADWSVDFAQVQVEALAKDSRSLLGFHWITVPASGGNPAIQVSAAPVADDKLLDVWFWLLATHQPGIALTSGTVNGTANPYNGVQLANVAATTGLGRSYLYGLMNVRAINAAEITQAQGGNYGFSSVDANSVVKLP